MSAGESSSEKWHALADEIRDVRLGHGKWHRTGSELDAVQMSELGAAMRETGQQAWSRRAHTTFAWY